MSLPFQDNFNRANADPIGGNWTTSPGVAGGVRIASNSANASATGVGTHGAYVNSEIFPADQYAQTTCSAASANDGPCVRQSTSADSHYRLGIRNSTTLRVIKRVAGVDTQLGADYTISAFNSATVLKLRVVGTTLTPSVDGVDLATRADSALSSGVAGYFWVTSSNTFDNFEAGSVGGSAAVFRNRTGSRARKI